MKVIVFTILVAIVGVATASSVAPSCPKACDSSIGEECVACGSSCPPTCENQTPTCIAQCVDNVCQCKKGLVRANNGKCIEPKQCPEVIQPPQQCPAKCPGGPHDKCLPCGTLCPKTCDNINSPPQACPALCLVNVCQCEANYVLGPNGRCIKPSQCPKKVCKGGIHDQLVKCGTECPLTCDQPKPRACSKVCVVDVCQCKNGYVRGPSGKCIKEYQCPKSPKGKTPTY